MSLICCTTKLLREIGVTPSKLRNESTSHGLLGQWHANLLHIDRRKCLLFVNDKTLFNFIIPDVSRVQIRDLPTLFPFHLSCVLSDEHIPDPVKAQVLSEYDNLRIGKSSDRSVLGSSNELAFHYKYAILEVGGVHSVMVPAIIRQMNRMPLKMAGFHYPIDQLKKACAVAA